MVTPRTQLQYLPPPVKQLPSLAALLPSDISHHRRCQSLPHFLENYSYLSDHETFHPTPMLPPPTRLLSPFRPTQMSSVVGGLGRPKTLWESAHSLIICQLPPWAGRQSTKSTHGHAAQADPPRSRRCLACADPQRHPTPAATWSLATNDAQCRPFSITIRLRRSNHLHVTSSGYLIPFYICTLEATVLTDMIYFQDNKPSQDRVVVALFRFDAPGVWNELG